MTINIIGWIDAFLLGICGFPQTYKTINKKTAKGLSLVSRECKKLINFSNFILIVYIDINKKAQYFYWAFKY